MLAVHLRLGSGTCYSVALKTTLELFRGQNMSTYFTLENEIYFFLQFSEPWGIFEQSFSKMHLVLDPIHKNT